MFLQVSVILFTGGFLVPWGGVPAPGGCLVLEGVSGPGRRVPGPGGCLLLGGLVDTPRTATAAGRMHPTGMHSCQDMILLRTNDF